MQDITDPRNNNQSFPSLIPLSRGTAGMATSGVQMFPETVSSDYEKSQYFMHGRIIRPHGESVESQEIRRDIDALASNEVPKESDENEDSSVDTRSLQEKAEILINAAMNK